MQEMCFFATKSSMKMRMKRKLAVVLLICISCHIGWAAQERGNRTHRITIQALDEGVVLDQLYVYEWKD